MRIAVEIYHNIVEIELKELEEFVSASPDGFILFSIGSLLPMNEMPEHLMKIFIKVFSNLPQRVIWQWKGTPKYALPANVKSLGWLPQQDLLGKSSSILLCNLIHKQR